MSVNRLYLTWVERIKQLHPKERITRIKNIAWLMTGIFASHSVHLSQIANKISGPACLNSHIQRLSRFLDNTAVRVREWYEPIAVMLLERVVAAGQEVRLVVDGSKVGFGHQLLMVALCYRRRAIPLAWTWLKGNRGHSSAFKQLALLGYVRSLIPAQAAVLVVGDSEFGANELLQQLDRWGWHYVLRQQPNWLVQTDTETAWQRLDTLLSQAGQRRWLPAVQLTQKYGYRVNLLAYWQPGEKGPWLLATNLPTAQAALRAYRRRMWIEEMFGDFKQHGFDLEATHLRHYLRLSRLTLAVSLLYLWLVAFGSRVVKKGQRRWVDRTDRRDFSIFRLGCNMLERCLSNTQPFKICLIPYF
jgi:hypothetical protein